MIVGYVEVDVDVEVDPESDDDCVGLVLEALVELHGNILLVEEKLVVVLVVVSVTFWGALLDWLLALLVLFSTLAVKVDWNADVKNSEIGTDV